MKITTKRRIINYQKARLKTIALAIKERHVAIETVNRALAHKAFSICTDDDKPDSEYYVAEQVLGLFMLYGLAYQVCRKVTAHHYKESLKNRSKRRERNELPRP